MARWHQTRLSRVLRLRRLAWELCCKGRRSRNFRGIAPPSVLPGAFEYSVGCVGGESGESFGAPVGYMAGAAFDENPFFVRGGMERLGASRKRDRLRIVRVGPLFRDAVCCVRYFTMRTRWTPSMAVSLATSSSVAGALRSSMV